MNTQSIDQQSILQAVRNLQNNIQDLTQAENYANKIVYDPQQYTLPILQLLLNPQIKFQERQILGILFKKMELNKISIDYLEKVISYLLQNINTATQIDDAIFMSDLLQCIIDNRLKSKTDLIDSYYFTILKSISQFIQQEVINKGNYLSALVLCYTYTKCSIKFKFENQIKQIDIPIKQINNSYISNLVSILENQNIQQDQNSIEYLKIILKFLEMQNIIFKNFFQISKVLESDYINYYLNDNTNIKQYFNLSFFLINQQNVDEAMQIKDQNQELNKIIYEIKIKSVKIIMICLQSSINLKLQSNNTGDFQLYTKSLIQVILKYYKSQNFCINYLDQFTYFNRFIKYSCRYLNLALKTNKFFKIFSNFKIEIIYDFVIPNLILRQKLLEQIQDDYNEYISMTEALIFEQDLNVLEYNVKNLLIEMCKRIDGVLYNFLINSISIIKTQINDYKYQLDDKIANSFTIQRLNGDNRIECFLMCYVHLKNEVILRDDLLQLLDSFLKSSFKEIVQQNDIVVSRFLYFIGEYLNCLPQSKLIDQFGKQINPEKIKLMKWILEICNKEGIVGTSGIQIVDTFHNLDIDQVSFLDEIAKPYLDVLINLVNQSDSQKGFETLIHILITTYPKFLVSEIQLCQKLINCLAQKIIYLVHQENSKQKQYITQTINLLVELTKNKEIVQKQLQTFEIQLPQLLNIIFNEQGKIRDWDEEYLQCQENILLFSNQVPNYTDQFLKVLPDILIQYDYQLSIVANYLNNLLYKFPEYFDSHKIDILLNILSETLKLEHYKDKFSCNTYLIDPLLILHVLIQEVGKDFNEQQFKICYQLFEQLSRSLYDQNEIKVTEKIIPQIYGIWLNLVIFVDKYLKFILTNNLEGNINSILAHFQYFYTIYEIKLLKIGIIRIFEFFTKYLIDQTDQIQKILNFLINYMRFIQNYQIVNKLDYETAKESQSECLKYFVLHDMFLEYLPLGNQLQEWQVSNENQYDRDINLETSLQKYQEFMGNFKTKVYYINDHLLFNNVIDEVLKNQPYFITNITSHLNISDKNFFIDNYKRSQYHKLDQHGKNSMIRRIVRYKR